MQEPQLLALSEAARRFRVPAGTLRQAIRRGHLKAQKVGPIWTVTAAAVGEWIAHARHTPGRPREPRP